MKHILSLGAGVQSSTLALMAARGEVPNYPNLDAAIFADTQDEPQSVYSWLEWLEREIAQSPHPYPVHRVTAGRLSERELQLRVSAKSGKMYRRTAIPAFAKNADGSIGIVSRKCTTDHKIIPILREARRIAEVPRAAKVAKVTQWIGISLDEVHRMKMSREAWAKNVWPLVDMRMRRHDCLLWMERNGYPKPPRSSCVFCPYHSNAEWRRLRDEEPQAFAAAVEFERQMQDVALRDGAMISKPYLHNSCVPLDRVDLSTLEDHGQMGLWGNECEGMCGV